MMRNFMALAAALVFSMTALACVDATTSTPKGLDAENVPGEHRALYGALADQLDHVNKAVKIRGTTKPGHSAFGVELLVANSNRGELLLSDQVFQATALTLDRLQDLGVRSVALSIQFPILTPSFPRFAEYRNFYQRVAAEIRRRSFVFIVEMGTFFRETEFTKLKIDYRSLTLKTFQAQLREMTETIIADLRPDYLTILSEPDTQTANTGLDFTVANFSATIRGVLDGLETRGVQVGAGAGTWNPMEYFSALMQMPQLVYIDMHVYPIQRDFVWDKALRISRDAQRHSKRVSIGEAWLYKVSEREFGNISPVNAFARDVYSFWQPLDSLFIEIMINLSHRMDAVFCSFFWMKYFYGYLDYNSQTRALTPQQLINKIDAVAGKNILTNTLSQTGQTFRSLINSR